MTSTSLSFADRLADLTIPKTSVPLMTFEPPRIWFHNGDRKSKTAGSFYTKDAEFPGGLGAPWADDDRFDGETGFSTQTLKVAVLSYRSQPFSKTQDEQGRDRVKFEQHWEKGMSILTELLCLIEGNDEPVVWSMKGLTGKAVTGKGGILQQYKNGLMKDASRLAGQGLPPWAFWLPVASKRTADGKIAYEDTGYGSFITPPALTLPENPLDALFGGQDLIDRGEAALHQYPTWAETRRLPQNTVEGEVVYEAAQAQLPPGRNAPQSYTPDDSEALF